MTDLTKTVAPKTDQLNADDFIGKGSKTITITGVREMDSKEQPISISFEGDNKKPWKPCLGMRRVLIELWGQDAAKAADKHYTGRRLTLYRDPDVKFGNVVMGGIRISHASNISTEKKIALTVAKARRVEFVVKPLADAPAEKPAAKLDPLTLDEWNAIQNDINNAIDTAELQAAKDNVSAAGARMTAEQKATAQDLYKGKLKWIKEQGESNAAE